MRKHVLILIMGITACLHSIAQAGETPNYANSAALPPGAGQASKFTSSAVNLFTGVPNVSIPLYSYKSNNGLGLSVSLEYTGGSGIQVGEEPGIVGLGWYLSGGGTITRTVRGLPDDVPTYGYIYAGAIPTDIRSDANKYYTDSIDSQQDVFQYNFPGHSGKFLIGKNGQIVVIPYSKIRIIPTFQSPSYGNPTIVSFRIIAEDGTKYDFENMNVTGINGAYGGVGHGTSWSISRMVSAFNTDTIHFTYGVPLGTQYGWKPPQITYVNNATGLRKTPYFTTGQASTGFTKLSSIKFPDKTTLSFVYSHKYKYQDDDMALAKLKISDTAFRFGYLFDYQASYVTGVFGGRNGHTYSSTDSTRLLLKSLTPFTAKEQQEGYKFDYNYPLFPRVGHNDDTIQNKRDHWGYFNNAINLDTLIPQINGYSFGADREPNSGAKANTLMRYYLPTGGYIMYFYESNTHYPYTKQSNSVQVAPATPSANTISLSQVFNTQHQLVFMLDPSVSRTGSPISGQGDLNISIKSTDGSITYKSSAVSLYDLLYTGMKSWTFNLPNGNYRLETNISFVTSVSGSFPVNILWTNKTADTTQMDNMTGGVRVAGVAKGTGTGANEMDGTYELYKYVLPDGRSSGFLGDVPKYDYPYRETIINGGTTNIDYTAISSQPISTLDFVQGAPVGYSRVEIIRHANNVTKTLGKEVQEYTDLRDINGQEFVSLFPNTPQNLRTWGMGLLKRSSVYDSSGNLVKRTVNNYQYDSILYDNNNFKGIKLGHSHTTYNGDPYNPATTKSKTYIGEHYYPANGWIYLTSTYDTLYQANGSLTTTSATYTYDTNYNLVKLVSPYDRTRGLVKEQRMYYPYHYTVGGTIGIMRDSLIISQPVATETWITGDGNPRISSANITTYRQLGSGDFKPDTIFTFESNKPILQSTIGAFDAAKVVRNRDYFKPQTYFAAFDTKGALSETRSVVTGEYNSIIYDYDQRYIIAKVLNAGQSDIAYTSFESIGSGNWTIASSSRNTTDKMTGKKSYSLGNGNVSKSGLNSSVKYLVTIWAKSGASFTVNGGSPGTAIASQQGWNLYSVKLTGITSVTISGSDTIDELRLHPEDANMVTSTYEPLIGVISTTDANNTVSYNEYDNLNRPWLIRDKDKNIVKRFQYSDSAMLISVQPVWQFVREECSPAPARKDSVYVDINPFSDMYGLENTVQQVALNCGCAAGNPQFKVVNGVCEQGYLAVVSFVRKKAGGVFYWECTWRYCFSDGSTSTYSIITTQPDNEPCNLSCLS